MEIFKFLLKNMKMSNILFQNQILWRLLNFDWRKWICPRLNYLRFWVIGQENLKYFPGKGNLISLWSGNFRINFIYLPKF